MLVVTRNLFACFPFATQLAGAYVKEMGAAQDGSVQPQGRKETPLEWHTGHRSGIGSWEPPCG